MLKTRIFAFILLLAGLGLGYFVATSVQKTPFRLGLDLSGGTHLEYRADISTLPEDSVKDSVQALRDIIERRVNLFGVSEPNVQTETVRLGKDGVEQRLIVELPGVTDIDEAVALIGQTPVLEFKLENPDESMMVAAMESAQDGVFSIDEEGLYIDTGLTGRYLKQARLDFSQTGTVGGQPVVAITFDKEGSDLFATITRENIGRPVAIFLDGSLISAPTVQAEITGGEAIITGNFTVDEAKQLVGRLNSGALPVPIELVGTESIGPSLGAEAVKAGVYAGILSFMVVGVFLIMYYRFPGLLATIALGIYAIIMLAIFKFIPITLTAAGIAGFIISLGIAVDANILIFERMKEELRNGRGGFDAIKVGFDRAWLSIRDGNISSIISAVILFWFGTSLIQGFALTFGVGVFVSMITAITVTRFFIISFSGMADTKIGRFLFGSGISR
jgi:preprotein translocase subunit SecD